MLICADCVAHGEQRVHPPANMDPHPLPDRAQPAPHPEPSVAGRHPGPHRHTGGGSAQATGGGATGSRGAGAKRGCCEEGGRRPAESRDHCEARCTWSRTGRGAATRCVDIKYRPVQRGRADSERWPQPQQLDERSGRQRYWQRTAWEGQRSGLKADIPIARATYFNCHDIERRMPWSSCTLERGC